MKWATKCFLYKAGKIFDLQSFWRWFVFFTESFLFVLMTCIFMVDFYGQFWILLGLAIKSQHHDNSVQFQFRAKQKLRKTTAGKLGRNPDWRIVMTNYVGMHVNRFVSKVSILKSCIFPKKVLNIDFHLFLKLPTKTFRSFFPTETNNFQNISKNFFYQGFNILNWNWKIICWNQIKNLISIKT